MTPFVSLHNHSEYSFLAGIPSIEALVLRAKALGMKALALTDTNRMSGLIVFYQLCKTNNIKPILGIELTHPNDPKEQVVMLAKNLNGYKTLCEITTQRNLYKDSFSFKECFKTNYPNIFLITHHLGTLQTLSQTPNNRNLYAELINQNTRSYQHSKVVAELAYALNVPAVATNNTFFLNKSDWMLHKILVAINLNSTLSRLGEADIVPANSDLKSGETMKALFPNHPAALTNTEIIAEQCTVQFEFGKWILPKIQSTKNSNPVTDLRKAAMAGLKKNYEEKDTYQKAQKIQKAELKVIEQLGYSSYFLMVKKIRDWANAQLAEGYRKPKDCTIMRGSAANSITFYNIGASDLDPIKYNLYFERFLNEDRASPPDADLDFGWDERDAVHDYFVEEWSRERVAVLCTTNHFKHKAAFRETAKVFGYSEEQISNYTKLKEPIDKTELKKIQYYAERITGKPRFLGQHPGGIIVTNDPICRHVALERSGGEKDRIITQIDMHCGIDELGLIKFDILGNGSLSVLRDTLKQLSDQGHPDPHLEQEERIHNDPALKALIRNGRTRGIFYIESPAQIRLNKKALAETFEEIGITSSAVRPAGAAFTKLFVERHRKLKAGIKDWDFLHPALEAILYETHDCLVFQEDVIKICHQIAGLSFKQADRVRKMMNSMHEGAPDDYEALAHEFMEGCMHTKGLTRPQARKLWEGINTFTGFSFCKSHSLSYAQLSFKCAYLKSHYPAQFLAAVISNNHGFYSPPIYLNEARRFGVKINPFNVNHSQTKYIGRGQFITPGLMHVMNLRKESLATVQTEKEKNGPFINLINFIERTKIGQTEIEALIKIGAFDCFGLNQPESLSLLYAVYNKINPNHNVLFGGISHFREDLHPGLPDYSLTQKCLNELELLGYMVSGNILDILDLHPASKMAIPHNQLAHYKNKPVKVFGMSITNRLHTVPNKGTMSFITLEDKTGSADIIFWPSVYRRYKEITMRPGPYEIWGTVQEDWGTYSVIAKRIQNVQWSPAQVDFELAAKRLLKSYAESYVYNDVALGGFVAA